MATFLLQSRNKEFRTYIHLCIKSYYICIFVCVYICVWASQVALVVKNLSANAGHMRDAGLVHGWGDHLQEEMTTHPSILTWTGKSHRHRSLVGYSPWGCKESDMTETTEHMHTCVYAWLYIICVYASHVYLFNIWSLIPARLGSRVTWKKFRLGSKIDLELHPEYVTSEKSLNFVSTEGDNIHSSEYGWLRRIR